MRRCLALLMLLCAGACATPQSPPESPTIASPLARAALEEWEAWGRVIVVGWPEMRPLDTLATPERFARLLDYWSVVPEGDWVGEQLRSMRAGIAATAAIPDAAAEDIGAYVHPAWSAAFISAVARRAGIPESDLPSSSRHAAYIDAALERAQTAPAEAYFRAYAPEERVPAAGDLLCADRSAAPLAHWSERLAEPGRPRAMHCDVVVRSGPGRIEAVGGNVEDLVALRRLPADAAGRILPAPPGEASFLLILSPRDGARRPPA